MPEIEPPLHLQRLHQEALSVAKRYKKSELELIEVIEKVDRNKVYYHYGYSSLFKYVNQGIGLSQEVTAIFINVARKTREVPALKRELKKGAITVSKVRRMSSVINKDNQNHWIQLAKTSSKQQLEREVAAASPKASVRDQLNYVHPSQEVKDQVRIKKPISSKSPTPQVRVQLTFGVSEQVMLKIRRVQDILSQKLKRPAGLEEAMEAMTKLFIEKNDPLERAQRQRLRGRLQMNNIPALQSLRPSKQTTSEDSKPSCSGVIGTEKMLTGKAHRKTDTAIDTKAEEKTATDASKSNAPSSCPGTTELKKLSAGTFDLKTNKEVDQKVEPNTNIEANRTKDISKNGVPLVCRGTASIENGMRAQPEGPTHRELDKTTQLKRSRHRRRSIPASLKHTIMLRDQGQCTHVDAREDRCRQRRFLEIHHLKPVAKGGSDELKNLTLLCSGHHRGLHHCEPSNLVGSKSLLATLP